MWSSLQTVFVPVDYYAIKMKSKCRNFLIFGYSRSGSNIGSLSSDETPCIKAILPEPSSSGSPSF